MESKTLKSRGVFQIKMYLFWWKSYINVLWIRHVHLLSRVVHRSSCLIWCKHMNFTITCLVEVPFLLYDLSSSVNILTFCWLKDTIERTSCTKDRLEVTNSKHSDLVWSYFRSLRDCVLINSKRISLNSLFLWNTWYIFVCYQVHPHQVHSRYFSSLTWSCGSLNPSLALRFQCKVLFLFSNTISSISIIFS